MSIVLADGKSAERKKKRGLCMVVGCGHKAKDRSIFCSKCCHIVYKERNPHAYWYSTLRRNAKRRKKVFTITLEYFIQFCNETGYIDKKGRKSGSMAIDRIIDELGYIEGNIQILEVGANTRKKYVDYWKHQEEQYEEPKIDISDIVPVKPIVEGDVPF